LGVRSTRSYVLFSREIRHLFATNLGVLFTHVCVSILNEFACFPTQVSLEIGRSFVTDLGVFLHTTLCAVFPSKLDAFFATNLGVFSTQACVLFCHEISRSIATNLGIIFTQFCVLFSRESGCCFVTNLGVFFTRIKTFFSH